jgi:hypothetical protein
VILLAIYVIVSIAAQAYDGPQTLIDNADDVLSVLGEQVFGSPLDKILIIAVLTSAAASTQTTILPTARTSLSMARRGAMPASLGAVHPRYLTPHVSTILMGVLSIVWYVGLTIVSENILFDSIAALGLMIAFYYGITGFACTIYYRRQLTRSLKSFLLIGVGPTLGRPDADWHLRQVLHRPLQARELRVRQLLARAGAASGDRGRLPVARRRADVRVERAAPGVLPAQARGRCRAGRGDGLMAAEILVGFDGRDGARTALGEATGLAKDLGRAAGGGVRLPRLAARRRGPGPPRRARRARPGGDRPRRSPPRASRASTRAPSSCTAIRRRRSSSSPSGSGRG